MADGRTPLLTDEQMRELGFADRVSDHWYLVKQVGAAETLNITIDKATGDYTELVIDEYYGQPAYYGQMVEPYSTRTRDEVDVVLRALNDAGLMIRVDHTVYGCAA